MKLLAFLFGDYIYRLNSKIVALVLRLKGVKVGSEFYIQGVPKLKIRGRARNIIIGNNVKIFGDIDIRNRENGQIIIEDNVSIDDGCRLVAANNAILKVGRSVKIGLYSVFNCGEDVVIGEKVLISGFCYIQSSNHGTKKGKYIQDQKHTYGKIKIGSDVWLGGHVTVLPGVKIEKGAVVGAKAVVTGDIPSFCIYGGVPSKKIGKRT